ncbi:MAG: glycan-binding surface protein [Paludibacteraceae bacterium]|nr:glycan-binding surface protein [Paludibacteraceae bacterium]
MKLRNRLFSTALASLAVAGGFLTSCEDDCVDCKSNMQVYDVVDAYDTETPLQSLRFDRTVIIRGEGLGAASHIEMVDGDGNVDTTLNLRPTMVTDKAIIVKLQGRASTINASELRIYSKTSRDPYVLAMECSGDPKINGLLSEFVAKGEILTIGGDFFYGTADKPLEVIFEGENGEEVKGVIKNNTKNLIEVAVPFEVKDGSTVRVKTPISETTASVLLNDYSKVFLSFDEGCTAGGGRTGAVVDGQWVSGAAQTYDLSLVPKGTGNYGVLSNHDNWDWKDYNTISIECNERQLENPEWGNRNLLNFSTGEGPAYDYASNNYVLKFEIFVPTEMPINHGFIFGFSEQGTENEDGDHYNGATFYLWDFLAGGDADAVPAAVVCFDRNTVTTDADEQPAVSDGGKKDFSTNGKWMTVALPLTSTYFHVACQASGLYNKLEGRKSLGHLEAKDFYNLWIFPDPNDRKEVTKEYFIAFDNFRIVEENGSGMVLGLYGQGTTNGFPVTKNDWFGMSGK